MNPNTFTFFYLVILFAAFYFLFIRPQQKQRKIRIAMLDDLKVGAEIYTVGGILGTITNITENIVRLQISEHVEIEILKGSVGGLRSSQINA